MDEGVVAMGLRAEKDTVHWAVVKGTAAAPVLIAHDKLKAPVDYEEARSLSWFRTSIQTLIHQHRPNVVACRHSESFLQHKPKPNVLAAMFARARIEGVAVELANSEGLQVQAGPMATIRVGLETKSAKAYLASEDLRGLDWSKIRNANMREAILAAVSVLGK